MKKGLLTMVVALLCALTCMFGFVACNNDETTEVKGKTYMFVELSVAYSSDFPEGQKLDEAALTEMLTGTTLVFGTDGTFEWKAMQQTGTYTQNNKTITFTVQDETFTGTVSGNDLTISDKMEYPNSTAFVTMTIKFTVNDVATSDTSVVGKTFIFETFRCEGMDDENLKYNIAICIGMTLEFYSDGTFKVVQPVGSTVSYGTYEQDGQNIIMNITEVLLDDEMRIDNGETTTAYCTFDGEQFIMMSDTTPTYYVIYKLQTAE